LNRPGLNLLFVDFRLLFVDDEEAVDDDVECADDTEEELLRRVGNDLRVECRVVRVACWSSFDSGLLLEEHDNADDDDEDDAVDDVDSIEFTDEGSCISMFILFAYLNFSNETFFFFIQNFNQLFLCSNLFALDIFSRCFLNLKNIPQIYFSVFFFKCIQISLFNKIK
jgi:hypothetical protein